MDRVPRVDHFGPSEAYVGGMASVIRTLRVNSLGADDVRSHSTWVPTGGLGVLKEWVLAMHTVTTLPRGTVVHVHVSEGGSFLRKGALLWIAKLRRHGRVATIHGYGFDEFAKRRPLLVRLALRPAHSVTVLTEEARRAVEMLLPAASVSRIENPVEVEAAVPDAGASRPIVFFGGEVGTRKGVDVLLRAWPLISERVPEAELRIAGPLGDLSNEDLAPGATYLGQLDAAEVRREIMGCRTVVLPSRAEARPMILLETAACGRPFVATPVGSVADLAADGGGVLVPVDDEGALASETCHLLEDPSLATVLGRAAHASAGRRGPSQVGRELGELYVRSLS